MYAYKICMRDSVGHVWGRKYRQSRFQRGWRGDKGRWSLLLRYFYIFCVSPMNQIPCGGAQPYSLIDHIFSSLSSASFAYLSNTKL